METKMLNLAIGKLSDEVDTLKRQVTELLSEVKILKSNISSEQEIKEVKVESNNDILLDTKEVMKILGVCYNSLYKLVREGLIKPIKINQKRVRFTKISILKYIQSVS